MPSPDSILGYCTNVHAGTDYASTLANLERYALPVKQQVSPDVPMGVGLWLAASAALEMLDQNRIAEFRVWLEAHGLLVFTMNGFPYGDFHQSVVKHAVYRPTWAETKRLDYTLNLVRILTGLLPDSAEGPPAAKSWNKPGFRTAGCASPCADSLRRLCRIPGNACRFSRQGRLTEIARWQCKGAGRRGHQNHDQDRAR